MKSSFSFIYHCCIPPSAFPFIPVNFFSAVLAGRTTDSRARGILHVPGMCRPVYE
jgi:hypothetical protein